VKHLLFPFLFSLNGTFTILCSSQLNPLSSASEVSFSSSSPYQIIKFDTKDFCDLRPV